MPLARNAQTINSRRITYTYDKKCSIKIKQEGPWALGCSPDEKVKGHRKRSKVTVEPFTEDH